MTEELEKNRNINRGFRKLNIWQLAIEVYRQEHAILSDIKSLSLKSRAQIEDSALSISSNIAEGYSRRTIKETIRFYEIALGSSAENFSQLNALVAAGQISETQFTGLDSLLYELENKLIKLNKNLIAQIKNGDEWRTDY